MFCLVAKNCSRFETLPQAIVKIMSYRSTSLFECSLLESAASTEWVASSLVLELWETAASIWIIFRRSRPNKYCSSLLCRTWCTVTSIQPFLIGCCISWQLEASTSTCLKPSCENINDAEILKTCYENINDAETFMLGMENGNGTYGSVRTSAKS